MDIGEQKKILRQQMLLKRAELFQDTKTEYDCWVCNALQNLIEASKYKTVHCYLPMNTEINIYPLIENLLKRGVTVVTPKTLKKRKLKHLVLASLDKLEQGVFGTQYPGGDNEFKGDYDLIIVPGLAFDANKNRLGYGGGYYDVFLSNNANANTIGVYYPFQHVEKIPTEQHDLTLNEVLVPV